MGVQKENQKWKSSKKWKKDEKKRYNKKEKFDSRGMQDVVAYVVMCQRKNELD